MSRMVLSGEDLEMGEWEDSKLLFFLGGLGSCSLFFSFFFGQWEEKRLLVFFPLFNGERRTSPPFYCW